MKKKIFKTTFLFLVTFCISTANVFSQDVITLKNGGEIQALVQEVGETLVTFKRLDNPDGPNYTLRRSEIFMIEYANGTRDVFTEPSSNSPATRQSNIVDRVHNPPTINRESNPPTISHAEFAQMKRDDHAMRSFLRQNEIGRAHV